MAQPAEKLKALADLIADYREGEVPRPDSAHVQNWLNQFDEPLREPILDEMTHVLQKTYVSKIKVNKFLAGLVTVQKLTGDDPASFWQNASFLDIQTRGNSQKDFLALFAPPLKEKTGLDLVKCGKDPSCYIYIDDGIWTGMTLIESLSRWLRQTAPNKSVVHVIVIAGHVGGKHYAETQLQKLAKEINKTVEFHWWALHPIEDRKININSSDVLRPTVLPDDKATQDYAAALKYKPAFRTPGQVGALKVFSTDAGRQLLEQQMLTKGSYIRTVAPNLPKYARPLGDIVLETLGF